MSAPRLKATRADLVEFVAMEGARAVIAKYRREAEALERRAALIRRREFAQLDANYRTGRIVACCMKDADLLTAAYRLGWDGEAALSEEGVTVDAPGEDGAHA